MYVKWPTFLALALTFLLAGGGSPLGLGEVNCYAQDYDFELTPYCWDNAGTSTDITHVQAFRAGVPTEAYYINNAGAVVTPPPTDSVVHSLVQLRL